jgi:hypothetical protein
VKADEINKGQRWRADHHFDGKILIEIIGGPMHLGGREWYTVRALEGRELLPGPASKVDTLLLADVGIKSAFYLDKYSGVIEATCPNCDIEDMIFYSEDYICAWCREMLDASA